MNPLSFISDSATSEPSLAALGDALPETLLRDAPRFARELERLARSASAPTVPGTDETRGASDRARVEALAGAIAESQRVVARRAAAVRPLAYDSALPILEARERFEAAIREHQVVIVAGETGSGKSTQIPKFLLDLGFGRRARIGITQPRRIAARAIAARLAEETESSVGDLVGVATRFDDRVSDVTAVKVMTDGILLNEVHHDRRLLDYDCLIIDEAHERSLNIDFLLGFLRRLLAERDDLRVVVTSATIDPERFAEYFGDVPVVRVGGRGFPVETRYRGEAAEDDDPGPAIAEACRELAAEGREKVLVFLPGEREIREAHLFLKGRLPNGTEILPLYSRLSRAAQDRVYSPARGPRIVLATNVAETSLTVPGIEAVVDTGTARISRYSPRSKVQRLPVEPISQAAAAQRAGRCGREGPGVCIRLYSEDAFAGRPEFTDAEIRRTNLATVILRLKALDLGELDEFPFLDPPPARLVRDGYRLLDELGALRDDGRLTKHGRLLARLPVDPQLGRMLIEARQQHALREVMVIAAALSIQDPREWPGDRFEQAKEAYQRWSDPRSDFLWFLNFWDDAVEGRASLSELKRTCRENFISFLRVREWIDVHRQLSVQLKREGWRLRDEPARYKAVHRSLLAGLLSNLSQRAEGREYVAARGTRFRLARSSFLGGKRPRWLVVMQIVETHRNSARLAARVEPAWVAGVAGRLLVTDCGEVTWDARRGEAVVAASRRLFNHTIQADLSLRLADIDPEAARRWLIEEGLVHGRLPAARGALASALTRLRAQLSRLQEEEERTRRRDIRLPDAALGEVLSARLPPAVTDFRTLARALADDPAALSVTEEDLCIAGTERPDPVMYPGVLRVLGHDLPLRYRFAPGEESDGVTVEVPLHLLNAVLPLHLERLVPGHLPEKVTALLRGLPKSKRKRLQPLKDQLAWIIPAVESRPGCLSEALAAAVNARGDVGITADDLRAVDLPPHLSMRIEITNPDGRALAAGRDLDALKERFGERGRHAFADAAHSALPTAARAPATTWDFGDVPEHVVLGDGDARVRAYPALRDRGEDVALEMFQTREEAAEVHRGGVVRLALLALRKDLKYLRRNLPHAEQIGLRYAAFGDWHRLREDLLETSVRALMGVENESIRTRERFSHKLAETRGNLVAEVTRRAELVRDVVDLIREIRRGLRGIGDAVFAEEIDAQLETLAGDGFLVRFSGPELDEIPRFLTALARRIERYRHDPVKDRRKAERVARWQEMLDVMRQDSEIAPARLREAQLLVEEFRVSVFAQELGTRTKVSPARLEAFFRDE